MVNWKGILPVILALVAGLVVGGQDHKMGGYSCPICKVTIVGATKELGVHFRHKHGLLTTKLPTKLHGWGCGETGCQLSFTNYKSLCRHLQLKHPLLETSFNSTQAGNIELPLEIEDVPMETGDDFMETEDNGHGNCSGSENAESAANQGVQVDIGQSVSSEAVKLVARLRSNANLTGASLSETLSAVDKFAHNVVDKIRDKISSFLDEQCIALDPEEVERLLSKVDVGEPFHGFDSIDKQVEALKQHCKCTYIDPKEIPLSERCETVFNKETNESEPKLVTETFQYIPIIETLKLILSNKEVRKAVEEEELSKDGFMRGFKDSECFKNNSFFQKYPRALRIRLYYDDILVNNPLGSKTHGHKLGMFYFTIENLPDYLQSFLGGIGGQS